MSTQVNSDRILDLVGQPDAFRKALRDWISETVGDQDVVAMNRLSGMDFVRMQKWWMAKRAGVGLAFPHWPREYGGADLPLEYRVILVEELARANIPRAQLFSIAANHVPATLIPFGTQAQKDRYLRGIALDGEIWCQGFSEPGAGSDLAALSTRAERDGDDFIVNGQKIWSSNAMYANWCLLLARTDPDAPKHKGISYFIMDMRTPGIETRPIRKSDTHADFAEMFLTDVRIPAENLIGPLNQGWHVANSTLSSERGVLNVEIVERVWVGAGRFLREAIDRDAAWLRDAGMRREFMEIYGNVRATRSQVYALLDEESRPPNDLSPAIQKLVSSTLRQRLGEFQLRAQGLDGQYFELESGENFGMFDYLESYGNTIAAGSNEIMRNIIAERGLDLPRTRQTLA